MLIIPAPLELLAVGIFDITSQYWINMFFASFSILKAFPVVVFTIFKLLPKTKEPIPPGRPSNVTFKALFKLIVAVAAGFVIDKPVTPAAGLIVICFPTPKQALLLIVIGNVSLVAVPL